ncbi:hypothetical protein [Thermocatellispora tengchongensis]
MRTGAEVSGPAGTMKVRRARLEITGPGLHVRRPIGHEPGQADLLLLYRHEDLRGLFVLDTEGTPLVHLPGPWPPDAVHRFAERHVLGYESRTLTRAEYLRLTALARDATR